MNKKILSEIKQVYKSLNKWDWTWNKKKFEIENVWIIIQYKKDWFNYYHIKFKHIEIQHNSKVAIRKKFEKIVYNIIALKKGEPKWK